MFQKCSASQKVHKSECSKKNVPPHVQNFMKSSSSSSGAAMDGGSSEVDVDVKVTIHWGWLVVCVWPRVVGRCWGGAFRVLCWHQVDEEASVTNSPLRTHHVMRVPFVAAEDPVASWGEG